MQQLDMYTETLIRHQQASARARLNRSLLLREALADRQVRRVQRAPFLAIIPTRIGRRLIVWAMRLQRRHENRRAPVFAP